MRALTVRPGERDSLAISEMPDPVPGEGEILAAGLALGVCGTDHEILAAEYGQAPEGEDVLILGHESLGRVRTAPPGSGFEPGDLVVGLVRRPDPLPCPACARDEFDMCRNGGYTERGIKQRHGYGSELWTVETRYAVRLDPGLAGLGVLMEPASVLAKAWDHIERIGSRAWFDPRRVLVTGAGPIGLLAALMARQRGLEVHVLDRVTGGPKPGLVRDLGAAYHTTSITEAFPDAKPDIVIEATGAPSLVFAAIENNSPAGIVCLTGVSTAGRPVRVDAGSLNRDIVLENDVVFGSVNANLRHHEMAAESLAKADHAWLARLINRRVPLANAGEAFRKEEGDVKVVIDIRED